VAQQRITERNAILLADISKPLGLNFRAPGGCLSDEHRIPPVSVKSPPEPIGRMPDVITNNLVAILLSGKLMAPPDRVAVSDWVSPQSLRCARLFAAEHICSHVGNFESIGVRVTITAVCAA
jgi:hypothetical protein